MFIHRPTRGAPSIEAGLVKAKKHGGALMVALNKDNERGA